MKKYILALFILTAFSAHAGGFQSCGEYTFKGVFKARGNDPKNFVYVINENTKSEMTFSFKDLEDVKKLLPLQDQPTQLKGEITKKMDGTKGVISNTSMIEKRFPNPLVPAEDTGIFLVKNSKCD